MRSRKVERKDGTHEYVVRGYIGFDDGLFVLAPSPESAALYYVKHRMHANHIETNPRVRVFELTDPALYDATADFGVKEA